jgi:GrpB-like predicted nucleotidyltransferase (UPF0157 family)
MSNPAYKDRKYEIVSYDPSWVKQFESEAEQIKKVFGSNALDIQHVGSTSVPGMEGKPTIDILVLVNDVSVSETHKSQMASLGYEHKGQVVNENSRLFQKLDNGYLLANVHVLPPDHPETINLIRFRDYLRSHPDEIQEYSKVKRMLFEQHPNDYAEYRRQKDAYLEHLKKRAFSYLG